MPIINEVIQVEGNGTISFGDYLSVAKRKVSEFELNGNIYNIKTHNAITRLEMNNKLLMETVPGAAAHNFHLNEKFVSFSIEGKGNTRITLELEPEKEYKILVDGNDMGSMKSSLAGKINFSLELDSDSQDVKVERLT